MKRGTKILICMHGSVLHNAAAQFIRRNAAGSATIKLDEDRGAYRKGDVLNVGPGEFSTLLCTVKP